MKELQRSSSSALPIKSDRTAASTAYGYALLPPVRNADPAIRDVHTAYRQEQCNIQSALTAVAARFNRSLDPMIWEGRAAEAVSLLQRAEGARMLSALGAHDLVIAPRLGEVLASAGDAAELVAAFRERRARLFVADVGLELTATGDAERRALAVLNALAESYDERRRRLWAEQNNGQATLANDADGHRQQRAAEAIRAICAEPARFAATDERVLLDEATEADLRALLASAKADNGDSSALSRLLAGRFGIRLDPKQVAKLLAHIDRRR